jgi:hypothetical protein
MWVERDDCGPVSNNVVSVSVNVGLSPLSMSVNVVPKILRLRVEAISIAGRYRYTANPC